MTRRTLRTEQRQGLLVEVYIIEGKPGIHYEVKGYVCEEA